MSRLSALPRRTFGEIEGYRFLAAFFVLAFHSWQNLRHDNVYPYAHVRWFWPTALAAADVVLAIFFIVSAVLLSLPAARAILSGRSIEPARGFIERRLIRVIPLYYLLVITIWVCRNYGYPGNWLDLVEHLTFTQWLDSKRIFYTIGPAWMLSVEVWFYLLIPILGMVGARTLRHVGSRIARFYLSAGALLTLVAGSLGYKWYVAVVLKVPRDHWAWYFGVPAKLDIFCIGMLLALLIAARDGRLLPSWCGWTIRAAAVAILVTVYGPMHQSLHWGLYAPTFAALPVAMFMAPIFLCRPTVLTRVLGCRLMLQLGLWTYALYLVHEPLLGPLTRIGLLGSTPGTLPRNVIVLLAISIVLAAALYELVESPANRLRVSIDRAGRAIDYYPLLSDTTVDAGVPMPKPRRQRVLAKTPVGPAAQAQPVQKPPMQQPV